MRHVSMVIMVSMVSMSRRRALVASIALAAFAACGRRPSPQASDSTAVTAQAAKSTPAPAPSPTPTLAPTPSPAPGPPRDSTLAYATLTVLSPDSIVLHRGSPSTPTLEVQYTISRPKLVRRAVLQLFNDTGRLIDSTVLPVQSEGTGSWLVTKPISGSTRSQWFEARLVLRGRKAGTGAVVRLPVAAH